MKYWKAQFVQEQKIRHYTQFSLFKTMFFFSNLGQPVLVEISVSLRNILEIDEHKQVTTKKTRPVRNRFHAPDSWWAAQSPDRKPNSAKHFLCHLTKKEQVVIRLLLQIVIFAWNWICVYFFYLNLRGHFFSPTMVFGWKIRM